MAVTVSHPLSTPSVCVATIAILKVPSPFKRNHDHGCFSRIVTDIRIAWSDSEQWTSDIWQKNNSLEKRRERYIIMFVWSILEQHAPNFDLPGNCGINSRWQIRRGRYCLVPRVSHQASSTVQTIRYGSFAVRGPMLFNTLPSELRNMTNCSSESFKQPLDTFTKLYPMSLIHLDTRTLDESGF